MATILVFKTEGRLAESEASSAVESGRRRTAEIVIFPGVRYEPAAVHQRSAAPPAQQINRPRDRLELIE